METTSSAFEEVAPGDNVFAAVGFAGDELTLPATARVEEVAAGADGLRQLESLIAASSMSVFHNLPLPLAPALASAPSSVVRVWSGWGGDYYGSTLDSNAGLLAPATRRLVHGALRPTFWVGRWMHALRFDPVLQAAARATDVFSAPIPDDLGVLRRRFPGFRGQYRQLNYVTLEDSIATGSDAAFGFDILLGNSASPTNNHLDVLELLASQDLAGRRVVAPLSYGDSHYADEVARVGSHLLGDSFVPVRDFLPLDEYNELLASCSVAVFGAWRQEALGNVLRALWQGTHVVLDRRNPIAGYLRERGVDVLLLDEIAEQGLPSAPTTAAQVSANRALLTEYWSRRTVVDNVAALVGLL